MGHTEIFAIKKRGDFFLDFLGKSLVHFDYIDCELYSSSKKFFF
jgi:hypothetical protein